MADNKKDCFVIMPYGKRENADGHLIDFDIVYDIAIKPAVEGINLRCIRSDRIGKSGTIHNDMFRYIIEADVVIVDITTLNPNVFYELGIRHTARQSVTILIGLQDVNIPFNINRQRVIMYDPGADPEFKKLSKDISTFISNGLKNYGENDSPIHEDLVGLKVQIGSSPPIQYCEIYKYNLIAIPGKKIGIITGDLMNIKVVDIWVNSENVWMEMARYYDKSISSMIRYYGAKKNPINKEVIEDTIQEELSRKMQGARIVPEATVIHTQPGELAVTNSVKRIFHVASVRGSRPGAGYKPIDDIGECVTNCLKKANDFKECKSILFPLMGTGTSLGELKKNVPPLINAAIQYFETNESNLECSYFLSWNEGQLDACKRIIEQSGKVKSEITTHAINKELP